MILSPEGFYMIFDHLAQIAQEEDFDNLF